MQKYILILAIMFSFNVKAEPITGEPCGDDCTWQLEDGVLTVIGSGKIKDCGEYGINEPWLEYRENIEKIVIQNKSDQEKFSNIGQYAFTNMDNLTEVVLPEGIETLSYAAFHNNSVLEKINLPSTLKSIGAWALSYTNISSVELPDGIETIGDVAFPLDMTNIYLPPSLFKDETPGISKYALARGRIQTIFCAKGDEKCQNYQPVECWQFGDGGCLDEYDRPVDIKTYQKESDGRYVLDGVRYQSFIDMQKGQNGTGLKRIYTIDEANLVAKPTGNTIRIKYR